MSDIRTRLEAHAAACRDAMDRGADRPALPDDLRDLSVANLSGANLGGANLSGADLRGADLRRANLRESNLGEANLSGANLREADLSGANLSGADLREADLRGTRVRVWIGGNYDAYTVPSNNGQLLAFGCERHTLDVWERDVAVLCKKHVRDHAERYEAEIRALIALCRVVEKEPKQ